jgi:NADH:ubiquinone oxidoreductase subunit 2 (subunit N)
LLLAILSKQSPTFWLLAALIAVNAAISAFYYLRIVFTMFAAPGDSPIPYRGKDVASLMAVWISLILTFALFFAPNIVLNLLQSI